MLFDFFKVLLYKPYTTQRGVNTTENDDLKKVDLFLWGLARKDIDAVSELLYHMLIPKNLELLANSENTAARAYAARHGFSNLSKEKQEDLLNDPFSQVRGAAQAAKTLIDVGIISHSTFFKLYKSL